MKPHSLLLLMVLTAIVFVTAFPAAGQVAYIHLKNRGADSKTIATTNENALAEIKNVFIGDNAKITQADSLQFTAELPNSPWAWEDKDGAPDNSKAIVVINRKYDIGGNQIKKPRSVTTIWIVTIAADKKSYTIRLQDALSIYPNNTKNKTGYSTGVFEGRVAGGGEVNKF